MVIAVLLLLIIVVGVIGNTINLLIFGQKQMRTTSTFRFLFYLAFFDLLALLISATDAFTNFGLDFQIRNYDPLVCRIHTFLIYLLQQCSSIILMSVSIDRALVLYRTGGTGKRRDGRVKRRIFKMLSQQTGLHRVDLILIGIVVSLSLINTHFLFLLRLSEPPDTGSGGSGGGKLYCYPFNNNSYMNFLHNYWNWIDMCVYCLIPFAIMSVCSVFILVKIKQKSKELFAAMITNPANKKICMKRARKNRSVLYMLLVADFYFLFSSLPNCVTFIIYMGQDQDDLTTLIQSIVHLLLYTNNAVNFIFYGLSSEKYRDELVKLLFFWRTGPTDSRRKESRV